MYYTYYAATCFFVLTCSAQPLVISIHSLPQAAGIEEPWLSSLFKNVAINPMAFDTSLLTDNGRFTESSLPIFLYQAYQEQKLPYIEFSKLEWIKVKNIVNKRGNNTAQLFLVTSTCGNGSEALFIVKESRNGLREATALRAIESEPSFQDIIAPKVKPGLPSLSLPFAYFSYPDKKMVHYIVAMPCAKRKVMADWVLEYQKEKTAQHAALLKRAFIILGKQTANFHKLNNRPLPGKILGLTIAHGDFHLLNIFYDDIDEHFTFIDNESIAAHIKCPIDPVIDICKPFYIPFNTTYREFKAAMPGILLGEWFGLTLKNFVFGYVSQFPDDQQKQVLQELRSMFIDVPVPDWVKFYDIDVARSDFINPLFDELEKELPIKS